MLVYFPRILSALPTTLLIVGVAAAGGIVVGAAMAIARIERLPVLRRAAELFVSFTRGTPIFIQMFVVYYGLPLLLLPLGIDLRRSPKMLFVLVAYSLNAGAFFSEIIRSSILSVPRDQWDAALSIGHSKPQTYLRVIIPQSVVIAIPSTGMQLTGLLQDTALTLAMGIIDVLGKARSLGNHDMRNLEAYVDVALIFIALSILIDRLFSGLEKRSRIQRPQV
jgi:L-cystine transport system permease protein